MHIYMHTHMLTDALTNRINYGCSTAKNTTFPPGRSHVMAASNDGLSSTRSLWGSSDLGGILYKRVCDLLGHISNHYPTVPFISEGDSVVHFIATLTCYVNCKCSVAHGTSQLQRHCQ